MRAYVTVELDLTVADEAHAERIAARILADAVREYGAHPEESTTSVRVSAS